MTDGLDDIVNELTPPDICGLVKSESPGKNIIASLEPPSLFLVRASEFANVTSDDVPIKIFVLS